MGMITLKGKTVKHYLAKFQKMPHKTLAAKIYKENTSLFPSAEAVRKSINYYTGTSGKKLRAQLADTRFVESEKRPQNPFSEIPDGITCYDDWSPVNIICEKALVLADLHAPYHDKAALEVALDYGDAEGVDTVVLLGDVADFYSVSFWEKDPRKRDFNRDKDVTIAILNAIRTRFPTAKIIYKIGNHEERYDRYMKVKAPELFGVAEFDLKTILRLDELNIQLIGDRRILKIAKLNLIHGHEFGRTISSPVNPARGLFLKGKEHCIGAHYHQTSHHAENTIGDDFIGCWSVGCICDMHPDWLPINKWNLGFGLVNRYNAREFEVFNKKIIDGKVYSG